MADLIELEQKAIATVRQFSHLGHFLVDENVVLESVRKEASELCKMNSADINHKLRWIVGHASWQACAKVQRDGAY